MTARDRQPLVPDGLPQGERQRTVAAMQRANIPVAPTQAPATTGRPTLGRRNAAGGQSGPMDLLSRTNPADFPFLADSAARSPEPQPPSEPDSPIQALAQSSQSTFGVAVLQRLAGR